VNREPTMPDEDLLSAYLDGECTDLERAWVQEQLAASPEMRAVLAEVEAAREAVRSLPMRDAPPEFWAQILAPDATPDAAAAAPVDLAQHRRRRSPGRRVAALAGVAAAAVIAAVIMVPHEKRVTPPVATFTDAHALRSSLQDDAVSSLVPLAVQGGFRR
jgi:anti-sigma factor RsiW